MSDTVAKLQEALIRYSLQAKILGQRLTPNAAIVRLKGSDRLKLEDIEKRRSQLLTTDGLNVISVYGQPGEIVVSIARPQRQFISLREVLAKRKINRSLSGVNLSFVLAIKEIDGELLVIGTNISRTRPFHVALVGQWLCLSLIEARKFDQFLNFCAFIKYFVAGVMFEIDQVLTVFTSFVLVGQ